MNIGIDIDDTLTNSSDIFVELAIKFNHENHIDHPVDMYELDQQKSCGWDQFMQQTFAKKHLRSILENAQPKPHAIEVLISLMQQGHTIILISSRKENEVSGIEHLTKTWLHQHGFPYHKLLLNCTNKVEECRACNIDVMIDDNFENCLAVHTILDIPVFMIQTRYNVKCVHSHIRRLDSWMEILSQIATIEAAPHKKAEGRTELEFIDVDRREDFPTEPEGYRFLHFYGGSKNYRGYIAPADLSRADFMEQYPQYIPEQNIPVYEHNGIILRADPKYPCPGFYILSLNKTYRAFDLIDDVTYMRFAFVLKKAKQGMRKALGINYAHLLSNEKSDPYVNVHFWLVPVNGITSPDLLDFDVKAYLNEFEPKQNIQKILDYNDRLRTYFEEIDLVGQDDALALKLTSQ